MSAHTLSVGLCIRVETLHSALATTTALVITCLNHIGREEPWMGERRGRMGMHICLKLLHVECLSAYISYCDCEECVHGYAQTVLYSRYIFIIKYN